MRPSDLLSRSSSDDASSEASREAYSSHLRDAVFGAIDGTVTTFAVVAGAIGAELSGGIVLILGLANLFADGLSMAVGNYLGERADEQAQERARVEAERVVRERPEQAEIELRLHYARLGLANTELERVVEAVTSDRAVWVETLMSGRFGPREKHRSPRTAAVVVYLAFLVAGAMPLLVFIADALGVEFGKALFPLGIGATLTTFFGVGMLKGLVVARPWWRDGLETLALGSITAGVAFAIGWLLRGLADAA